MAEVRSITVEKANEIESQTIVHAEVKPGTGHLILSTPDKPGLVKRSIDVGKVTSGSVGAYEAAVDIPVGNGKVRQTLIPRFFLETIVNAGGHDLESLSPTPDGDTKRLYSAPNGRGFVALVGTKVFVYNSSASDPLVVDGHTFVPHSVNQVAFVNPTDISINGGGSLMLVREQTNSGGTVAGFAGVVIDPNGASINRLRPVEQYGLTLNSPGLISLSDDNYFVTTSTGATKPKVSSITKIVGNDLEYVQLLDKLNLHTVFSGTYQKPSWSPLGKCLVLSDNDGYFEVLDASDKLIPFPPITRKRTVPGSIVYTSWSPNGRYLSVLSTLNTGVYDTSVKIYDAEKNYAEVLGYTHDPAPSGSTVEKPQHAPVWSPDGRFVISVYSGDAIVHEFVPATENFSKYVLNPSLTGEFSGYNHYIFTRNGKALVGLTRTTPRLSTYGSVQGSVGGSITQLKKLR